jgi:UDP-galactopyranose mutase
MREELKKLPGHLEPIAFNYEPDSYVIQKHDTREKISRLKALLSGMDFHLVGRFAEWEYYNMDMAILSAMRVCDQF